MKKYKLQNGLKIIELKRKSDIVTIHFTVHTGSNNEIPKIAGISHFVEHMVFEGTKNYNPQEIANSIESLGGQLSAYTSNEVTCFFVKITKKHVEKALEILSEIITKPSFEKKLVEKERPIILSEIKMVQDEPRHHQWTLFYRSLFDEFPAKNPIYGNAKAVSSITQQDLIDYHKMHYTAPNSVVTVVGNILNIKSKINKYFNNMNKQEIKLEFKQEKTNRPNKVIEKKKTNQSYVVLGYKTAKRDEKDSYVFDIIRAILGRGLSGKLFRTIRIDHGMAYDVGVHSDTNITFGTFSAYFSTNKKNIKKCIDLTLKEFQKLKKITTKELKEAKQFIEGEFILDEEDSHHFARTLAEWELVSKAEDGLKYVKEINKVTKKDITRVVNKYLNKDYSLAVIEQV